MLRFLSSTLAVLSLAVLVWFVVSNTEPATLRLAVLAPEGMEQPLALWIAATAIVGFLLGAVFVWIQAGSRRSDLRRTRRSLTRTEDDLDRARADLLDREAEIDRLETEVATLRTIEQPAEDITPKPVSAI
ncbi:MAG: hypothetical protein CMF26_05660 [Kiloniella sp.]|nr:hypothetical protein [Kiloniella sp.]